MRAFQCSYPTLLTAHTHMHAFNTPPSAPPPGGRNAQVAARMVSCFTTYRNFDSARSALMRAQLERISAHKGLSENVFEIASKSLA